MIQSLISSVSAGIGWGSTWMTLRLRRNRRQILQLLPPYVAAARLLWKFEKRNL